MTCQPHSTRTEAVIRAEQRKHDAITAALAAHTDAVQRALAKPGEHIEAELRRLQGQLQRAVCAADNEFQAAVASRHLGACTYD